MNLRHALCTAAVLFSALAGSVGAEEGAAPTGPNFKDTPGKYFDILRDGKPLLRYMYEYDASTPDTLKETYKVYSHVFAPDGTTTLTKGAAGQGSDFPHHHGIFVGWNGIKVGDKSYDLWHMKGTTITHSKFLSSQDANGVLGFTALINWNSDKNTKPIIEEKRTFVVHTDDTAAHLNLDFTTELKAVAGDVSLNMDKEHAGVQYRPSLDVTKNKSAKYVYSDESVKELDTKGGKLPKDMPWVAMTYKMADGSVWTVEYMNSPANPKNTEWSAYRDYGRFGAIVSTKIKNGETLTLKCRIRITKGEAPSREELNKQYAAFAGK